MSEQRVGCERCRYLLRQDEGYSNYTPMDTLLYCLKGVHPEMDGASEPCGIESPNFDRLLGFGERCTARVEGDPMWLDVDGEVRPEDAAADDDVLIAYRKWSSD